jgi:hypothetical protein
MKGVLGQFEARRRRVVLEENSNKKDTAASG